MRFFARVSKTNSLNFIPMPTKRTTKGIVAMMATIKTIEETTINRFSHRINKSFSKLLVLSIGKSLERRLIVLTERAKML